MMAEKDFGRGGMPGWVLTSRVRVDRARSNVRELFALQLGEVANSFSGFLFCNSYIVEGLQVQPKLRAGTEEMSEAQGGIAGDTACAVEDLGHAVGGHGYLSR